MTFVWEHLYLLAVFQYQQERSEQIGLKTRLQLWAAQADGLRGDLILDPYQSICYKSHNWLFRNLVRRHNSKKWQFFLINWKISSENVYTVIYVIFCKQLMHSWWLSKVSKIVGNFRIVHCIVFLRTNCVSHIRKELKSNNNSCTYGHTKNTDKYNIQPVHSNAHSKSLIWAFF